MKWIRRIDLLSEYTILDRKLDTPYPMEVDTPYRVIDQNRSGSRFRTVSKVLDTVYRRSLKVKGLTQDRFRLSVFPISLGGATSEWFKKDCTGSVTTWEDLVEKFVQKFYQLSDNNEEMEADESDDPDDIAEIFKTEGNLFDYVTPKNYGADNAGNTQDNQEHKKEHHDPSTCRVRRFEMIKYSFNVDDEYVSIKEHEYSDRSKTNIDACQDYRELFRIMDEGWLDAIRRILGFRIRRIDYLYRPCCKEIEDMDLEECMDDGDSKVDKEAKWYDAWSLQEFVREENNQKCNLYQGATAGFGESFMRYSLPCKVNGQGAWDVELDLADSANYVTEKVLENMGFVRVNFSDDYSRKMVNDVNVEIHGVNFKADFVVLEDCSHGRTFYRVWKDFFGDN
ncbi:hypothetical protein Tco_0728176 [Tanacetum coccineum]|uniref:Uncharacterized protein n=1 Tax=Tanacetum coccineum TaxID=301880 RepID=A0ABQ4YMR5_9ASTR